jgi:hypothetical protein
MITDGLMDSVGHETDPFDMPDGSDGGVGYPAVVMHAMHLSDPDEHELQRLGFEDYLLDQAVAFDAGT